MSTPNVRAFYAAIGIELPARGDARHRPLLRAVRRPPAHRHLALLLGQPRVGRLELPRKQRPRWRLRRRGGEVGHSPRSAMDLLIAHGLAEPRAADYRPTDRQARQAPPPAQANQGPAPAALTPFAVDEEDIASWAAMLDDNSRLTRRLALERAWGIRVIRQLRIGFDGARMTIPVRDAGGALQPVLRYDPFGPRDPQDAGHGGIAARADPDPAEIAPKSVVLVEGPPDMIAGRSCGWQRSPSPARARGSRGGRSSSPASA